MATITLNTRLNTAGAAADARALRAKLARQPIELTINRKSLAQPLGRISGDVAEFTKSLQAATARVTAFGATSGGIIAVSQAISQVAKSVIEVDKQLTELNTFLGQSQSNLSAVGDKLFKIAKNTASSFEDTAEAAKEFARQGLSLEETLKRTNDALILSRISGLGAAESVNALTTAINSFNKSALSSTEIVNKLVKVDSNFAVSSADLAQALTRVGSAAQDSGVGFEELIATVTTAQQVTGRGGAVIGNALKTIFTRLKRPEVLDQLQQLGVAVKDQNGALLSGTQVLTNYINATKNLSQVEKARNDELLGGVYQINQLKAITNDLAKSNGIYARSLQIANSAADDAINKNKELNKSLSAILQNTRTNIQQKGATIGEPLFRPIVKRGTDIVNTFLDTIGQDRSKASKEGEDLGESFGEAVLKGIGEAISGPGLVLFGALSVNIGKRLFGFVNEAAKVLLNINTFASNVKNIEQAINNTLAQQPKLLDAISKGQITREQAAAQLLKLYSQQNQQLALQKNLSANLAQTFAKSGFVASPEFGIYQGSKPRRKSEGYIPNYALRQEESEARRRNAPADVKAFATTAVIGGKEQTIIMNNYEDKQDRFRGGIDSAIIPRYAKGNIPNFAKNIVYYKSNEELKKIIESQSPQQKFLRLSFISEKGFKESANIPAADITRSSVVQRGVRKDLLKNAPPPKGFNSWKEFQDARLILSVRRAQTDTGNSGFRYRRLDRITEAAIGGTVYRPSQELEQRNALTRSLNAKELKRAGLQPLSATSARLAKGGAYAQSIYGQMEASAGGDQRKILQATQSLINDLRKSRRLSGGYVPNFAASRASAPRYIPPPNTALTTGAAGAPASKTAVDTGLMSAVQTAILIGLTSSPAAGFANENNQEFISGGLKAAGLASVLAGAGFGFKTGGIPGAIAGGIGGGITGSLLFQQGNQVTESVRAKSFEKARDKAQNSFNKLTENIADLTQTIADIDAQYSDPNARPDALLKLAKREREILRKLSAANPEAAAAYTAAATPAEKQMALATAGETAQKELALSKTVVDFAELKKSERDAKAVGAFFRDLASQLDSEKVNVGALNEQNFQDFLNKGGIGKAGGLFNEGASGEQLKKFFIEFLKVQNQIQEETKKTEAKLLEARRPSIEARSEAERRQQIRAARSEARGGFLESVGRFAGNFGERSSIEAKTMIDQYTASRPIKETFANQVRVQAESLSSPALKSLVTAYAGGGASKELSDRLKSLINNPDTQKFYAQDLDILRKILAQNTTSTRELQTLQDIAKEQKNYALKALSLQEKLAFGGGIKTSIDAEARIQSVKNTQRGALQYQLGSLFGSKETQAAGLTNFASNLKEKYPGLFESEAGQQIFGGLRDQLTSFRAADMRESMLRDAVTAQSIGQSGLASLLQGQAGPSGAGSLFEMARLQAEQQLGLTPSVVGKSIIEAERENVFARQEKASESFALKTLEDSLKPQLDAISGAFVKTINQLQEPLQASLKESFSKGLEIANATLVVNNLELGSLFGKASQPSAGGETTSKAGGFIPNFSNSQNPLAAALGRESNALKQRGINPIMPMAGGYIPNFASARVSVVSDNRIANGGNPNGLAVINSIDEPNGMIPMSRGFIPNFAAKKKKPKAPAVTESTVGQIEPAYEPLPPYLEGNKYANEIAFASEVIYTRLELNKASKEQREIIKQKTDPAVLQAAISGQTFLPSGSNRISPEIQKAIQEAALQDLLKEADLGNLSSKEAKELTTKLKTEGYRQQKTEEISDVKKQLAEAANKGPLARLGSLQKDLIIAKRTKNERAIQALERTIALEKSGILDLTTPQLQESVSAQKATEQSILLDPKKRAYQESLDAIRYMSETGRMVKEASKGPLTGASSATIARLLANPPSSSPLVPITPLVPRTPLALLPASTSTLAPSTTSKLKPTGINILPSSGKTFLMEGPKIIPTLNSPSKATSDALKVKPVSPQILNREQFLNDPLIQAAVQDFKNTLSGKSGGASGMGGGGGVGGGAGGGAGGGVFKPFALLPAPGQTTTTGPWTQLTADIQQRFFGQGGPLQSELRPTDTLTQQQLFDIEYAKKTLLSRGARDTRRISRLQNAPFGKFGAARKALYEYNYGNVEAQNKTALIKNIILSQSGLSPAGIKAMTGLYPNQLEGLSPSSLESLLRKRNINIEQKNIEGFGRRSSPEFFVEPQLLTNIDLTKARLTPEEIAILEKSAAEVKPTRRFITDPSGKIIEQTTSTLAQKVIKYPNLVPQEFIPGAASSDFRAKKTFLENLPSTFLSGISSFRGQIGGFSGYVGEKDITKKANELLKLEELFAKNSELLSEGSKQALRNQILEKSGPYAAEVQQRFNDLLSENNFTAIEAEVKNDPSIKNVRGGSMTEGNLDILQKRLSRFVEKGMLTPEQASQIQEKIALKEKGMGVMEYDRALQNLADRRGAGEKGANIRGYYESVAEMGGVGARQEQIISRQRNAEIAAVNSLIQNEGIILPIGEKGIKNARFGSKSSVREGEQWLSFTKQRVEALASNIENKASQQTVLENLKKLRKLETEQRSILAKRYGMEYDPISGKVVEQGTRAGTRAEQLQQMQAEKAATRLGKIKAKIGGGLSGAGAGLYGLIGSGMTAYQAFEQSKQGENIEAAGLLGASVSSAVGGATMFKKVQNVLGESLTGKVGGAGFGIAGAIGKSLEASKAYGNQNKGKAAYLGLESLVSASAAVSAVLGQKILTQRLFALGAGLDTLKQIYDSPNFQLAGLSDEQKNGSFLSQVTTGLLAGLTGQNFSKGLTWESSLAAAEDVISSAFVAGMGPAGAAVTTAKIGYRIGNVIEDVAGLGEKLGSLYTSDKQKKRAAEKLDIYGLKKSDAIEQVFGGDEAAYAEYLRKQRYQGGYFTPSNETGGFGILPSSAQIGNTASNIFSRFANLGKFMFSSSKTKPTGSQMTAEDMGMSYFANGFIPNFALFNEMSAIRTNPDYAGYRNARPMMSSAYNNVMINSAEMEVPAREVYARMGLPPGTKPRNSSEQTAILNPAQQKSLGYAAGGFVPNFSSEEFMTSLSSAMKEGMVAAFANGFIPSSSPNSYNNSITFNGNTYSDQENNDMFKEVLRFLVSKNKDLAGALGPQITKIIS